MDQALEELVREWLRIDKDEASRGEISELMQQKDTNELEKRLRPRISFGTAGLRARMEAGFARMNCVTVIQASQGLAEYLLANEISVKKRGVVIGYDARHNSEKFARLAAAAFVSKGIKVFWYEVTVHTPLVPFGVNAVGAAAGIMVTASHNPAHDNGYKVYWSNGCQIVPPHDAGIAACIEQNLEPLSWDTEMVDNSLMIEASIDLTKEDYFKAVEAVTRVEVDIPSPSDFRFVYTPMHGVGLPYMRGVVDNLGLGECMAVVGEQADPDPDFPTIKFPNPEEKGALDLAIETADNGGVDLILASDPDADRLAVAEKRTD
ncbi:hypothetical protein LTS18_012323, partial [Coniosporium uncinatum]